MQGNFDPSGLYAPPPLIRERARQMLAAFDGPGYIVNLGHGIRPDTPVEHAQAFIDAVREVAEPNGAPLRPASQPSTVTHP